MRNRLSPSPSALAACTVLMGSFTCVEAFSESCCFTLRCRDCHQNWVIWSFERNDYGKFLPFSEGVVGCFIIIVQGNCHFLLQILLFSLS